jgi:menaquinone-9 beta-reductase
MFDCAIIGGGLGGLSLSILLAKEGKKVVLFEKESYPFHKVCGEYISMESWDFLHRLGLQLADYQVPIIKKLRISACNGVCIEQELKMGGFGISRYTLDSELVKIAKNLGVQVLENHKVETVTYQDKHSQLKVGTQNFEAKVVCGSYGKKSNVDVQLKRSFTLNPPAADKHYIGVKYHVVADLPTDLIELHNFADGYCGISKVDDLANDRQQGKARYCLCYLTTAKNLRLNQNKVALMEENILMKNPFLHRYLADFERLYDKPLVISQINFEPKKIVEDHILMLGDSAGLITPLCGNGMSLAMHAAHLLAPLLVDFLENKLARPNLEETYSKTWQKHFANRLLAGRMLQKLFGNPQMTNLSVGTLRHFPVLVQKLIGLTHGTGF